MKTDPSLVVSSAVLVGRDVEIKDPYVQNIRYFVHMAHQSRTDDVPIAESLLNIILSVFQDQSNGSSLGKSEIHLINCDIDITNPDQKASEVDWEQLAFDVIASYKKDLISENPSFLSGQQVEEARKIGLSTTNKFKPIVEMDDLERKRAFRDVSYDLHDSMVNDGRDGKNQNVCIVLAVLESGGQRKLVAYNDEYGDHDGENMLAETIRDIRAAKILKPGEIIERYIVSMPFDSLPMKPHRLFEEKKSLRKA